MNTMNKAFIISGVLSFCSIFAVAQQPGALAPGQILKSGSSTQVVANEDTTTAIVNDVDKRHRLIKLQSQDGNIITMQVSPNGPNLDQIHNGDNVQVTYLEPIVLSVESTSSGPQMPVTSSSIDLIPAQQGAPAGPITADVKTMTATVDSVDTQNRTMTVHGSDNSRITLRANSTLRGFDKLKSGDSVAIQFSQPLVMDIKPA